MDVQERNGIKTYEINTSLQVPEWLSSKSRRSYLKQSSQLQRRISLLQGLDFPIASTKIISSPDGNFILGLGTYKPRIKCWDVQELGMKWERYLDAHGVDVCCLGYNNWTKLAILTEDRSIVFHAPYGHHYEIKIPNFGSALLYNDWNCQLCVSSRTSSELYRFDCETGRFVEPLVCSTGSSTLVHSPTHRLTCVGCTDGSLKMFDGRVDSHVVNYFTSLDTQEAEISTMAFHPSGYSLVLGTVAGFVKVYDLRSSKPLETMEHVHGLPIHTARFHSSASASKILSADAKLMKLWNASSFEYITTIESPTVDINNTLILGDEQDPQGHESGLLLCASEQPRLQAFFCPALGKAPKWCSYLDSITEELEENTTLSSNEANTFNSQSIYQDYTFVTNADLEKLAITNLIGTPFLKGYMHGYFMDTSLYTKLKAVSKDTFDYQQYQQQKIKSKIQAQQSSRITLDEKQINQDFYDKLQDKIERKHDTNAKKLLQDERFNHLFTNNDFVIDEEDENYKLRNPTQKPASAKEDYDSEQDHDSDLEGFEQVDPEDSDGIKMYEATSDNAKEHALSIGLGDNDTANEMKDKIQSLGNLTMREQLDFISHEEKDGVQQIKNVTGGKEIHYIPKDATKEKPRKRKHRRKF